MMEASFEMVIAQCHHLQIVLQLVGKIGSQMLIDLQIVLSSQILATAVHIRSVIQLRNQTTIVVGSDRHMKHHCLAGGPLHN